MLMISYIEDVVRSPCAEGAGNNATTVDVGFVKDEEELNVKFFFKPNASH